MDSHFPHSLGKQHRRETSAVPTKVMEECDIAIIQEPCLLRGGDIQQKSKEHASRKGIDMVLSNSFCGI